MAYFTVIDHISPIRMSEEEEVLGGDHWIFGIVDEQFNQKKIIFELKKSGKNVNEKLKKLGLTQLFEFNDEKGNNNQGFVVDEATV